MANQPFFIPESVDGQLWQAAPTEQISRVARYFSFSSDEIWRGFTGYAAQRYLMDTCKLLLTTPDIDAASGEQSPAAMSANYLHEKAIVPERQGVYSKMDSEGAKRLYGYIITE